MENEVVENVSSPEPVKPVTEKLLDDVAAAKTSQNKFAVLKKLIESVGLSDRDVVETVFNLVSVTFLFCL